MMLGAASLFVSTGFAAAGPPYLTDDPQPTDAGHWEIYNFVDATNDSNGLGGEAGLDINYGGAKDLQLTAVLPIAFDNPRGVRSDGLRGGSGVVELAAKYRFIHQAKDGWAPDISVFPRVLIPTQSRFGPPHPNLFLPIWAEKDFGSWSVFGGGGYQINPGADQRSFWQYGLAITRDVTQRLNLGVELFRQTDDTRLGGGFETVNFGVTYKLVEHWSLLVSAGPTRQDHGDHGQLAYVSLKADY